jgi:hypothetical protein
MDDTDRVHLGGPGAGVEHLADRVRTRDRAPPEELFEGDTGQVLHDEIGHAGWQLSDVENTHDVFARQERAHLGLAKEPRRVAAR